MSNVNRNVLLAVLGFIVVGAAFYMLALKPKREEIAALDGQIAEVRERLSAAQALLAANEAARQSFSQAYASVVRLGKAVPADDDVRSLVIQLDAAARSSKVDFRSIQVGAGALAAPAAPTAGSATTLPPGATIGPAGFPVMPFSFSFKGSFFKLGDFFRKLESFVTSRNNQLAVTGRLLTLDTLTLTPDADGFPAIRASVGATSYLVSPLEGATAGATASGPGAQPGAPAGAPGAPAGAPAAPGAAPPPAGGATPSAPSTTATSTGAIR